MTAVSFGIGFLASSINQAFQYGFDNINFLQSAIDGLFALGSTALAYTGIGLLGSALLVGIMGACQYNIDSGVFNNDFSWSGLIIATGLGAVSGAISGRGAQNATAIAKRGLNQEARSGIKTLLTAVNKHGIDSSAYKNTLNLWGKIVATAINEAIFKNFTSSVIKIWITAVGSYFIGNYLGKLLKSKDISF